MLSVILSFILIVVMNVNLNIILNAKTKWTRSEHVQCTWSIVFQEEKWAVRSHLLYL